MRYEKGLNPNLTEQALARCIGLIKKIIPNAKISSKINVGAGLAPAQSSLAPAQIIEISVDYINKKIGAEIPKEKIILILKSLGFDVAISESDIPECRLRDE